MLGTEGTIYYDEWAKSVEAKWSEHVNRRDLKKIVKDWRESSRYARTAKAKAEELYDAITDKKHGVLPWIKGRW